MIPLQLLKSAIELVLKLLNPAITTTSTTNSTTSTNTTTSTTSTTSTTKCEKFRIASDPDFTLHPCPDGKEITTGTECNEAAQFFGFPGGLPGCTNPPCSCLHYTPSPQGFPRHNIWWST